MSDAHVEVVAPRPRRARGLVAMLAVVSLGVAVAVGLLLPHGDSADDLPDPTPTGGIYTEPLTVAQETLLVWREWQEQMAFRDCASPRGWDSVPHITRNRDRLARVAAYLNVEPADPGYENWGDFRHVAMGAPGADPVADVFAPASAGGCQPDVELVDVANGADVARAVGAARSDEDLLAALATTLWLDAHPDAVLRFQASGGAEPSPSTGSDQERLWGDAASSARAIVSNNIAWSPAPVEVTADYAQVVGTVQGGAMLLRVEPLGTEHPFSALGVWGRPVLPVACDTIQLTIATYPFQAAYVAGQNGPAQMARRALIERWCEAIEG